MWRQRRQSVHANTHSTVEYLAYEVSVHRDAPMVTWVTVTIEDDEIVTTNTSRQGTRTQDEETEEYSFAWNELTKKELGDDYGMVERGGALLMGRIKLN